MSDPSPNSDTRPAQQIGEYRVVRKLGEGGMGAVYLAEDPKLARLVALKTMKPELAANRLDRERFLREARTAAAVRSDYIVPIWGLGEADDGTPFIAMEFLEGEMLDARLKREPVPPVSLTAKVAYEVAEGLAAAHAKGLIHRDIKPGNIWLEGDPASRGSAAQVRRCKILDFGLARSVDKEEAQITASGAILGTPAYMSPEQARGAQVDPRADLFSLGATLYRMVTGRLPFDGPTPMAVLIALTTEDPPPVREIAPALLPELADLIDRLMRKDREERPRSAAEVAATARRIMDALQHRKSVPTVATPVTPLQPASWDGESLPESDPVSRSSPQLLTNEDTVTPAEETSLTGTYARRRPQPKRFPVFLALIVAVLALTAVGLWLSGVIGGKKPDPDVAQNGDPKKPDGPPTNGETPKADPDREAATYILSRGGQVLLDHKEPGFKNAADLPKTPFKLTNVRINDKPLTDAELAVFKDCTNLEHLDIGSTRIGDEGLKHFSNCKELRHLDLGNTRVTDASIPLIKSFAKLTFLQLEGSEVTAKGIAELKQALAKCEIQGKGVAVVPPKVADPDRKAAEWVLSVKGSVDVEGEDEGITELRDLPKRPFKLTGASVLPKLDENMQLRSAQNADLAVFKDCTNITSLYLAGDGISNEGLAHFGNCKKLKGLYLSGTKVDDKAAATIKQFTQLEDLILGSTEFTDKGVLEVAAALPGCRIQFGYTIEPASDADRKAAEWVLSIGGRFRANYGNRDIADAKDVPKGPFRLTEAHLGSNRQVTDKNLAPLANCKSLQELQLYGTPITDAGLAHFKGCKSLTTLTLSYTDIGDVGLANFKDCTRLEYLELSTTKVSNAGLARFKECKDLVSLILSHTKVGDAGLANFKDCVKLDALDLSDTDVTDKGLAHFKDCKNLRTLSLVGTKVSNAGLTHFKDCKNLYSLVLSKTQVGDEGLALFKDCKNLTSLQLSETQVTDKGLAHFANCPDIRSLALASTKVGDAGLAHFKNCKTLTTLRLSGTEVTDKGLAIFKDCKDLTELTLAGTKVTDDSVAVIKQFTKLTELSVGPKMSEKAVMELAKALPKCRIQHPGGTIEPVSEDDRKAAEWLLAVGGEVLVNFETRWITKDEQLPKGVFRLTGVSFKRVKGIANGDLAHFKDCKNLTVLDLSSTEITAVGLVHFKGCKNLTTLDLSSNDKITDVGLANFKECVNLQTLKLPKGVSEKVLHYFKDCKRLRALETHGTNISDTGFSPLADCKELESLEFHVAEISDLAFVPLKECKNLESLSLSYCRVSAVGLAPFKECKTLRILDFYSTPVSEAGLAHFQGCEGLRMLTFVDVKVTEAGLAHFKQCKELKWLTFAGSTSVNDACLAHFKECKKLTFLKLDAATVTDVGLANFKECKEIDYLHLSGEKITDVGLAHFKECKELDSLWLEGTQVSEKSVNTLKQFSKLGTLTLPKTQFTEKHIMELSKALSSCRIFWKGDTVEPKKE